MSLRLTLKLPSYDFVHIDIPASELNTTRIGDLPKIVKSDFFSGFCIGNYRFVYAGSEISQDLIIQGCEFNDGATIDVIMKMTGTFMFDDVEYVSYVRSVSPSNDEIDVRIDTSIVVCFGASDADLIIYTPAFIDNETLPSPFNGNMLEQLGVREAKKKGFVNEITKIPPNERIFLVELNPRVDIERVRYSYNGVSAGYTGGDFHSWQRYTSKMPVECRIIEETDHATGNSKVIMRPLQPLSQGTKYAIVLANNVPTIPRAEFYAPFTGFGGKVMCEDKLYVFQTQSSAKSASGK